MVTLISHESYTVVGTQII